MTRGPGALTALAAALLTTYGVLTYGSPAQAAGMPDTASTASTETVDEQATALLARPALNAPVLKALTPAAPVLSLDPTRDYVVSIPTGAVFTRPAAIVGGHNVVLESATLRYAAPAGAPADWIVRGLFLKAQTGVMWVNGLQIRGPLAEGIDLEQRAPDATVVLHNIAIDQVSGTYDTNHADLLQTWAGPAKLVVDGFTGSSNYQGMFLKPNDLWADGPRPAFFSLSNLTLDVSTGYYALWTDGFEAFPMSIRNVSIKSNPARTSRNAWLWPKPSTGDTTWSTVLALP